MTDSCPTCHSVSALPICQARDCHFQLLMYVAVSGLQHSSQQITSLCGVQFGISFCFQCVQYAQTSGNLQVAVHSLIVQYAQIAGNL